MTDVRKVTPQEIAAAVSDLNHELRAVGEGTIDRIDCSPENIEQGLARLVLSLVELLRRLLERQAIRRMEGGSLNDVKVEEMGQALMKLEMKVIITSIMAVRASARRVKLTSTWPATISTWRSSRTLASIGTATSSSATRRQPRLPRPGCSEPPAPAAASGTSSRPEC